MLSSSSVGFASSASSAASSGTAWSSVSEVSSQRDGPPALRVRLGTSAGLTSAEREKLRKAAAILERTLNDPRFEKALKEELGAARGAQVWARLQSGSEVLSRARDGEADLRIGTFNPSPSQRRKVAISSSGQSLIRLNKSFLAARTPEQVSRTLAHMMAFKFGQSGRVPEVMGRIAERLARTPAAPTPGPTPAPTPAPAPVPPVGGTGGKLSRTVDQIFTGFRQTTEGNCVAVAAIKAAMVRFGPGGVFKSQTRVSGGWDVVMRDGYRVRVSDAELRTATSVSDMKGKDGALLEQANLIYAAMAKRAQQQGNDGLRNMTYARACESLNDGESYREGPKWLGLEAHVRKIRPSDLHRYDAAVAASSKHAVFSSGKYVDHYGTKKPSASGGAMREGWGRVIVGAWAFV